MSAADDAIGDKVRRALQDSDDPVEPGLRLMHPCPVGGCVSRPLPVAILMCPPHWRMVPKALQRAVYAAYRGGRGLGTPALARAQREAIDAVLALLTPELNGEDNA